ncbi:MAG TPA: DNA polymerase III subunit gamma/tau C-terminal domain-containing protein, partial [Gammaproteobacteria bacterium]|nr:DNA polymerase III subunit gamma/tau C-terminal domain-containing protein [Gammaproteobacteria bacterium]
QFYLKQILPAQIVAQLQRICESEGLSYESEALAQLARAADGSLRDALSLLDQAIVFCQDKLCYNDINRMLGYIAPAEVLRLLQALAKRDGKQLFTVLADLQQSAPDYQQVLAELILCLHQAAVFQVVPTQLPNEMTQTLAGQFSAEEIQLYYQIALLGQKDLPLAPSAAQGFEMLILRMLAFKPFKAAQEKLPSPVQTLSKENKEKNKEENKEKNKESKPAESLATIPKWSELLPQLGLTGVAYALALNCKMESLTDQRVGLILAASYQSMMSAKLVERIEQALSRYFNRSLGLTIRITEDEVNSPAKQHERENKQRQALAFESMQQDPGVQKIKDLFNATLDLQSLEVGE